MEYVKIEYEDNVAVIKMDDGVTNPIQQPLIDEFENILDKIKGNPDTLGIVLTGSNEKFFSIGLDVPGLYDLNKKDFTRFFKNFNRFTIDLYKFPKPTVAAVSGHAAGGGGVLALCCDYRFIGMGRKLIGLNEINHGLPVPYPADRILRKTIGYRGARAVIEKGELYGPEKALEIGLADRVLPMKSLISESVKKAAFLGKQPQKTFEIVKRNKTEKVVNEIMENLEKKEKVFVELWFSDFVRSRLRKLAEKF